MKRKRILRSGIGAALLLLGLAGWNAWFAATRIAFINYQTIALGEIAQAGDCSRIELTTLDPDDLGRLGRYDLVMINGMGLRITEAQRARIEEAAADGVPVFTTMATNPANEIISVDSAAAATLKAYLGGGGRRNYRNMLRYIRRTIDGKRFGVEEAEAPVGREEHMLYHADPERPEAEELGFDCVADYEAFLQRHGLLKEGAPRIVVTGQMGDPTDLVRRLEETGNAVYPARDMRGLIDRGAADTIRPSAVIDMAHGRLGDYMVDYLRERNIPLFAPLNVNRPVGEWEADKMGMNGGFLSQSVVMPEIDGAIRPYALFGHYADKKGLQHVRAIPERLETFVETVNRHLALQRKPNSEKRVAIYYYKGPGQNAMTATGLEVVPSLYNLLLRMKREGYRIENLPASAEELGRTIQRRGALFGRYAEGAKAEFLKNGDPELITREEYDRWTSAALRPEKRAEADALDGPFPGSYMATGDGRLALARIELGNVVLLPQPAAGAGDDDFAIVHGTDAAPPHVYIAAYLWARYGFGADAMVHFGTHGSLEFTPKKQAALSSDDWADRLVGPLPHLYLYSIGDVGEGMIAKRRSYAALQSHLTPPFMESNVRGIYRKLDEAIREYDDLLQADRPEALDAASLKVKRLTVELGIHRDLRLDSLPTQPYTEEEIARIETFAEELANEKITGELYTLGQPYSRERIASTVRAMAVEPIAYSLLALDKLRGRAAADTEKHKSLFTRRYLVPARELVERLLEHPEAGDDDLICRTAKIGADQLRQAREIDRALNAPQDMMSMMRRMAVEGTPQPTAEAPSKPAKISRALAMAKKMGASEEALKKMEAAMMKKAGGRPSENASGQQEAMRTLMQQMLSGGKSYTKEEIDFARAVMEAERTIRNVGNYRRALAESPEREMTALVDALNGGYTAPSPGGDPVANPNTLPTGRNLYAVNAEATPSERAWERGVQLARRTIEMYRQRHNDSLPRKVSYTLWSGEFVETEGATLAQVLYMLGVEPIRDVFGRVNDIRLIPSEELGRPRIDVVVQTSGQLRDIAASRLFLISRAVEMAAAADGDRYENFVAQSTLDAQRTLIDKGLSPKEAREISTYRVFGGANGNYGTGITGMVQSGDRWDDAAEIAAVYLQNMGAFYGSEKNWEEVRQFAFEAALTNTDAVIQPRQSNTWGALSLDHVYEFMGGMNLAVRNVTGKEPDAYLSDYRNRNNMRMQELKEAIGAESRTTIFNPTYIEAKMRGSANAAAGFAEIVQNTYGWNVMKPEAIDDELWDEIYEVYVEDKFALDIRRYFETQNPAALEEMTAVMLETARKGMWRATDAQLSTLAELHADLVEKYRPSCSGFVCDNAKLRDFIASKTAPQTAARYTQNIREIREAAVADDKGMVMKREELTPAADRTTAFVSNTAVVLLVLGAAVLLTGIVRKRRNTEA